MVVNGHYPGEGRRTDLNDCGQPVHQVLTDYQDRANGGDGWLRYFTFKPSENKIYAYHVLADAQRRAGEFETDDSSQFVLDYNLSGRRSTVIAHEYTTSPSGSSSHGDVERARGRAPSTSGTSRSTTARPRRPGRCRASRPRRREHGAGGGERFGGDAEDTGGQRQRAHATTPTRRRHDADGDAGHGPANGARGAGGGWQLHLHAERELQRHGQLHLHGQRRHG